MIGAAHYRQPAATVKVADQLLLRCRHRVVQRRLLCQDPHSQRVVATCQHYLRSTSCDLPTLFKTNKLRSANTPLGQRVSLFAVGIGHRSLVAAGSLPTADYPIYPPTHCPASCSGSGWRAAGGGRAAAGGGRRIGRRLVILTAIPAANAVVVSRFGCFGGRTRCCRHDIARHSAGPCQPHLHPTPFAPTHVHQPHLHQHICINTFAARAAHKCHRSSATLQHKAVATRAAGCHEMPNTSA